MNTVELKFFVQGYYNGNGQMKSVKNNQDTTSPLNEVETATATLWAGSNAVETATATLQTDGTAVFEFEHSGDYHISAKGRNSIEVFTPVVLNVGENGLSYDFTVSADQAHGSNQVEVETNVFALISGDIDGSGEVTSMDKDIWEQKYLEGAYGDQVADLNGDGLVDTEDFTLYESNIGKSVSRP